MNREVKVWQERDRDIESETKLVEKLEIDTILARLLIQRGIKTPDQAARYFQPSISHLHDPFLIPDMEKAALRIIQAIDNNEKIFIHGDYDADGVTSTSLYVRALQAFGANLIYKVPHRKDGYDIKADAVVWAKSQGASLIITSDCGVQAYDAVAKANELLNLTIIITDHHEPGEELPPAYAVVNPHRADSEYPFQEIAGVGVAFKVMQAVVRLKAPEFEDEFINTFLDLAACGSIADVMPLIDENRVIAHFGLERMRSTEIIGLKTLLRSADVDLQRPIKASTISFAIAPRINAVGRLDDASVALDLMLTEDEFEAASIVDQINTHNVNRRAQQQQIYQEAVSKIEQQNMQDDPFLIVSGTGWHHGLVGIVAGMLAETYHKPAIVVGINSSGMAKGSGRSIPGYSIFSAVEYCKDIIKKGKGTAGGHAGAVGISFDSTYLGDVSERLIEHAENNITKEHQVSRIYHDGIMDPEIFQIPQIEYWESMEPFGNGNPEPVFCSSGFKIAEIKTMGKEQNHLRVTLIKNYGLISCVAWNKASWKDQYQKGQIVDILFTPTINEFNGKRSIQFILKDIR